MVLASQGRVDAANVHYKRAFQLNPQNVVAANNLAASLSEQQDLDDALGFARDALALAPSNPAIKDTLGWVYYKQGRFDKAYPFLAEGGPVRAENCPVTPGRFPGSRSCGADAGGEQGRRVAGC